MVRVQRFQRRKTLIVVFGGAGDSAHAYKCHHVGVLWSQGKQSLIVFLVWEVTVLVPTNAAMLEYLGPKGSSL
jgi:hypothetical protein